MSTAQLSVLILGICLLVMACINVFALMKLIPLIDSEDKGIHELQAQSEQIFKGVNFIAEKLQQRSEAENSLLDVDKFEAPLQGISAEAIEGIDDSLVNANSLLAELDELSEDDDWAAWRAANEMQIKSLLKMHEGQLRRLSSLRMELDQARATILNLRAGASRPMVSALQASAVQAKNTTIEAELWSLKAERGRMQQQLKLLQKELDVLRAQAEVAPELEAQADPELAEKCMQLEATIADLEASQAELQGTLDRSLREKEFIEEAFVRLDKMLGFGSSGNMDEA